MWLVSITITLRTDFLDINSKHEFNESNNFVKN